MGGKYKVAKETASDGSKVGAAVVVEAITIPAATDTKVLVMYRGPAELSKGALVVDATYDNATKQVTYHTTSTVICQILHSFDT